MGLRKKIVTRDHGNSLCRPSHERYAQLDREMKYTAIHISENAVQIACVALG